MATLTENTPRIHGNSNIVGLPVIAADIIYQGSAVGLSSGYARPLVAGDSFMGFAIDKVDNSGGSAGDKNVELEKEGELCSVAIGSLVITSVGAPVYMSDDNTFTLTAASNSLIGYVSKFVSAGVGDIVFSVAGCRTYTAALAAAIAADA